VPTPLHEYLADLWKTRSTGLATNETAYYPALRDVFNAVGRDLRPKVFCQSQLKQSGAGQPDFGLFSQSQLRGSLDDDGPRLPPDRGVIEAKGTGSVVERIATTEQVTRYWEAYGLVLVTNLRDFLLIGRDQFGRRTRLEHFSLASDERSFWELSRSGPGKELAERFEQFLKRVLLHRATLTQPKDVAWFLASYARDALARIDAGGGPDHASLERLRNTLQEALGLRFDGDKGEHFFRSTLIQTLFYGLFSAWVLWCRQHQDSESRKGFSAQGAAWHLKLPVLRALFEEVNRPGTLNPLRLGEVMEWAANTLCRVDDKAFFSQFKEEHAVQYFYEPFLEAFDPALRKALGVWYTPHEVVEYMVERVDRVLRTELDIEYGLADPRVLILDPCCGTGSYLVAVLNRIERTLRDKGDDGLIGRDIKTAAMERVIGFELLPAPFVVAHLQIGLLLDRLGVQFNTEIRHTRDRIERAAIYLTNALTGWGERDETRYLPMPELHEEMDRARQVKRERPILVVLGNPPYNAFAGVSPKEEQGLVEVYKEGLSKIWGIKKYNLDDYYIRFFRIAEKRIADQTGQGAICFISNYSYLSDPSFVVMRQRLLTEFDSLWFDNMNGDSRETGKLTPNGNPDPSVFSTDQNRQGIRVGTAIGLLVRRVTRSDRPSIHFRNFWGSDKREQLIQSLTHDQTYEQILPDANTRFSFRPSQRRGDYNSWPPLNAFSAEIPVYGLMEKRGGALFNPDRDMLTQKIGVYLDPSRPWETAKVALPSLARNAASYDAQWVRAKAVKIEPFSVDRVVRYSLRAFDVQWAYYSNVSQLWNRNRPVLWKCYRQGLSFLVSRFRSSSAREGHCIWFSRHIFDDHAIVPDAAGFPFNYRGQVLEPDTTTLFGGESSTLSELTIRYLQSVGGTTSPNSSIIWLHALAIGYAPAYLAEHKAAIRGDWPHIPLPASRTVLDASADLGRQVAALLDPDTPVEGVTAGSIRPELKEIGAIRTVSGRGLDDEELQLTAGWGHAGQNGVTMPGRGRRTSRPYTENELEAFNRGARALKMDRIGMLTCLGEGTGDIWLNDVAFWSNVPQRVWEFTIGGYQVMKKWLSYREFDLLGRALTPEEAREVTAMARRLAALCLLQPALDANYRAVTADTYSWPNQ
jgi:hypothetical protein